MTLRSLRKLPTTQPNTLTFAELVRLSLAALGLATVAVSPAWADAPPTGAESAAARRVGGGHTPWRQLPDSAQEIAKSKRGTRPINASRTAAPPTMRGKAATRVVAQPVQVPVRVQQTGFEDEAVLTEGSDPVPSLEEGVEDLPQWPQDGARIGPPIPVAEDVESCERREGMPVDRLAQRPAPDYQEQAEQQADDKKIKLIRPFRQMREIKPHYDYEPDFEMLKTDRCYNLCPRPGSPDCPECDPNDPRDSQGGLICPDCPAEAVLRDLDRKNPSINDFPIRNFAHIHYCWEPTNMSALPLYFEDVALERYGHTRGFLIDPPFKVGLFALQFIGLPYQMTIDPPWIKRYALGFYRPGQFVCPKYYQVPWNTKAAVVEASVLTGSYFLFSPATSP